LRTNIIDYFENGALKKYPEKVAIIDDGDFYSFKDIETYSKRCATFLLQRINSVCEPIAVYLPKSASVIFADLGIVYSGNIYCNVDTKLPSERLRNTLANIGPSLVITSRSLAADILAVGYPEEKLFFVEMLETSVTFDNGALLKRLERLIDTDPLCIINTSGSTGTPKGVVLHHRGTLDFMDWVFSTFDFTSDTKIACLSPFYFDIYTLELNLCLAKGATMVLVPEQLAIFPAKLMGFLQHQSVNFLFWVPSIMVNIANLGLLEKHSLPNLNKVFFAGEVFPTRHLNMWRRALPHAQFVNLYGPIEIHVDCTYFIVDRDIPDDQPLPIGYPCRNSSILILNESNQCVKPGEQGELCVRGTSLSYGYWNDPEKTSRAFVQNPLNKKYPELIYRTGDLAIIDDRGEIYLLGRKDFQIKHMGYRIELPEIEHQVLGIPGIANACVLYNQNKKEITLFYQSTDQALTAAMIRKALAKALPKYMLPTAFHMMERLPMNPNGKIDRNGLLKSLEAS
jgi:D-alanine--poly(phosphoribitol) ligase subunit 1